jgi:hypothetical protein
MDRIAREMELQRPGRGVTIDAALGRRTGEAVNLPNHRPCLASVPMLTPRRSSRIRPRCTRLSGSP